MGGGQAATGGAGGGSSAGAAWGAASAPGAAGAAEGGGCAGRASCADDARTGVASDLRSSACEAPARQPVSLPTASAATAERRFDTDGGLYTKAEFVGEYGGTAEWEAARRQPATEPSPRDAAPAAPAERRYDTDGGLYTKVEFIGEYGGTAEWEAARRQPAVAAAEARGARRPRGAGGELGGGSPRAQLRSHEIAREKEAPPRAQHLFEEVTLDRVVRCYRPRPHLPGTYALQDEYYDEYAR